MTDKEIRALDVISGIDEDIVDRHLIRRFKLWHRDARARRKTVISVVAAVACFLFMITTVLLLVPNDPQKQIPIYQGMTLSSVSPIEDGTVLASSEDVVATFMSTKRKHHSSIEEAVGDSFLALGGAADRFYARAGEDVYITIHLSNPDKFEILSFTLNGVKYASYMFEKGSDLETLVLKYNVGNAKGKVDFTIDAIKYVDKNEIKDVRMDGDKTVTVYITPEDQPRASVVSEYIDFHGVSVSVDFTDAEGLLGGEDKRYLVIYDGNSIVAKQNLSSGSATVMGLRSNAKYEYGIVAVYDALDGEGERAHLLYKKEFNTNCAVELGVSFQGMVAQVTQKWSDTYTGEKKFISLSIYDEDGLVSTVDVDTGMVYDLPYGKTLTLVGEYNSPHGVIQTEYQFVTPNGGLLILDGVIVGIGDCTDSVLYLDMPIADNAFKEVHFIKEVYMGDGVTSIGNNAFSHCWSLSEVVMPDTLTSVGDGAFEGCTKLTRIELPRELSYIGFGALEGCTSLEEISLPFIGNRIDAWRFGYIFGAESLDAQKDCVPSSLTSVVITNMESVNLNNFSGCSSIKSITFPANMNDFKVFSTIATFFPSSYSLDFSSINVPPDNPYYKVEGNCLIDMRTNAVVLGCKDSVIPDGMTSIAQCAFMDCVGLESISIPDSITRIERRAFLRCTDLKSVKLSSSLTYIGKESFLECKALESITIPSTVVTIERDAFTKCESLVSAIFIVPDGWTAISTDGKSEKILASDLSAPDIAASKIKTRYILERS
jgi:hypothetical protein